MLEWICAPDKIDSRGKVLTPADWMQIGCEAGQGRKQVGLAATGGCSEAMVTAVTAGILSTGADVWDFGRLSFPEFRCCVMTARPSLALLLTSPRTARMLSPQGETVFPVGRFFAQQNTSGQRLPMENLRSMYPIRLLKAASCSLEGLHITVSCSNVMLEVLLQQVLFQLGASPGPDWRLELAASGERIRLIRDDCCCWEETAADGDGPALAVALLSRLAAGTLLPHSAEQPQQAGV